MIFMFYNTILFPVITYSVSLSMETGGGIGGELGRVNRLCVKLFIRLWNIRKKVSDRKVFTDSTLP